MTQSSRSLLTPIMTTLFALAVNSPSQSPIGDYEVKSRGEHHRVWQRVVETTRPDGQIGYQTNSYTELADHLCYWDTERGQWEDSLELIEIVNGYGVARHGAHQVIFAPNLRTYGAIEIYLPDAVASAPANLNRFRLHPLGLAYTDCATGDSVLLADIQDAVGEIHGNRVLYRDCFTDGILGSIEYIYTRSGIEQNIILECVPPDPAAYELDPQTTRLEVLTEMVEAPAPRKTLNVLRQETNPALRGLLAEPDLVDEVLSFGSMAMPTGSAFPLNAPSEEEKIPTAKSWEVREGRTVLFEKIDYRDIRPHLEGLPQASVRQPGKEALQAKVIRARDAKAMQPGPGLLPPAPARQARNQQPSAPSIQMARRAAPKQGYVVDFTLLNPSALTNYTFAGDKTYLVNGILSLYGTTIIEGGAVVKYTNTISTRLSIYGDVDCQTSTYRPAIFTAKDDDTVGQAVSGSTGSPSGTYASYAFLLWGQGKTYAFHDIFIRYANYGLGCIAASTLDLKDSQIGKGYYGISLASNCVAGNVLFYELQQVVFPTSSNNKFRGEHLTVHLANHLYSTTYGTNFHLTNCILARITNAPSFGYACNVMTNFDDTGLFQSALGGKRYLAENSPYRNCGTTNINPSLLTGLRARTTYPPLCLTNSIASDLILTSQAARDTDTPDLGYHYAPIDFWFTNVAVAATLTLTNGVVVAATGNYGLDAQAAIRSEGSPTSLNRLVNSANVQESPSIAETGSLLQINSPTANPGLRFRFTDFSLGLGGVHRTFLNLITNSFADLTLRDCWVCGADVSLCPSNTTAVVVGLTNNLFESSTLNLYHYYYNQNTPISAHAYNNLFRYGSVQFTYSSGTQNPTWNVKDNLFDGAVIYAGGGAWNTYLSRSNNGFTVNSTNVLGGSNNKTNLTADFQVGPLGRFYYPTSGGQLSQLLNAGSRNATNAGLYFFTTTTNQACETNSTVDVGFHYVALDASGNPLDIDGEGLANYLEDRNGDGLFNTGETNWNNADTDGDGVNDYLEWVQGRNPLVNGTLADSTGLINFQIYTPLR